MDVGVLIVVLQALGFDFTNGFHDAANSIATVVAIGLALLVAADSASRRRSRGRRAPDTNDGRAVDGQAE